MTGPTALALGNYYHLFNRGTNRENIFKDQQSYHLFLGLYAHYVSSIAETYAFCLLRNHFHFLIRVKSKTEILRAFGVAQIEEHRLLHLPSQNFSNLFNAYAKKVNLAFQRTGSLFQHPFRRVLIGNDNHLHTVIAYIHQNPQRHRLVDDYREWPFSSYHAQTGSSLRDGNQINITRISNTRGSESKSTDRQFSGKKIFPLLLDDFN
jgi:putative transposase